MKRIKSKKAMTLVEVLVASVIVGVIAVGMLGIFVVAKKTTYKTGDKIIALGDTRTVMLEKITREGYNFAEHWEGIKHYGELVPLASAQPFGNLTGQNETWDITNKVEEPAGSGNFIIPEEGDNYTLPAKWGTWSAGTKKNACTDGLYGIKYCHKPIEFTVTWTER